MPDIMTEMIKIVAFSLAAVAYMFLLSKLLGKKQIAQLDFIDYTMGISIGSIAAQMATDLDNNPFYYYIIAMTVFFLFHLAITFLERKGPVIKKVLKGRPITVIYDGKVDYTQLKKSKLDVNDLIALCRERGYFDLNDIAYAIFENSGNISILPKGSQRPAVAEDLGVDIQKATLPYHLVVDGRISFSSLTELKKERGWLYKKIGVKNEHELKNVLIAEYNQDTDRINVSWKNA